MPTAITRSCTASRRRGWGAVTGTPLDIVSPARSSRDAFASCSIRPCPDRGWLDEAATAWRLAVYDARERNLGSGRATRRVTGRALSGYFNRTSDKRRYVNFYAPSLDRSRCRQRPTEELHRPRSEG